MANGAKTGLSSTPEQTSRPRRKSPLEGALLRGAEKHRQENDESGIIVDTQTLIAKSIPIDLIDTSPYQPRLTFDQEKVTELAALIDAQGLQNPIKVRPVNNRYELIAGERRLRAHKLLKKTVIQAFVVNITDEEASTRALVDNHGDEPLTEFETYRSIRNHLNKFGGNHDYSLWGFKKSVYFRLLAFDAFPQAAIDLLVNHPGLVTSYSADEYKKLVNAEVANGASKEKFDTALKTLIQRAIDTGLKLSNLGTQVYKHLNPTQSAPNKAALTFSGGKAGEITKRATYTQLKLNHTAFTEEKMAKLEAYLSELLAE